MSSTVRAFDKEGNEVFYTEINSLCPIEYLEEAKKIAYDYFIEVEKVSVTLDQMFTKFLKLKGQEKETHCWCPRAGYTHQLNMQIERMTSVNKDWVGKKAYTLNDDHNELLSKFVCITNTAEEILQTLGLEEI